MRYPTIIVFLTLLFCSCKTKPKEVGYKPDTSNFSTNLAFSNQDKLYYYTTDKKQLSIIKDGYDANISPDGSYLAFTDYYKSKYLWLKMKVFCSFNQSQSPHLL